MDVAVENKEQCVAHLTLDQDNMSGTKESTCIVSADIALLDDNKIPLPILKNKENLRHLKISGVVSERNLLDIIQGSSIKTLSLRCRPQRDYSFLSSAKHSELKHLIGLQSLELINVAQRNGCFTLPFSDIEFLGLKHFHVTYSEELGNAPVGVFVSLRN